MIVDAYSLFRVGVIYSLSLDEKIKVVGQASSGDEALQVMALACPDVVLLDTSIPWGGIEVNKAIKKMSDQAKVVILTTADAETDVMRAVDAGAVGYILKNIDADQLVPIIKSVAAGGSFFAPGLTQRLISYLKQPTPTEALASLTDQEERTLRLVSNGLSNREVAAKLGILEKTVKYHMTHTMAKLGVRNRVEATIIARQCWAKLGQSHNTIHVETETVNQG
ncbi:response regulator [Phyllobacterium endophyticum]|uniref:response regulator n=1 Tax=Phyllobacterium endophyticum TaxID=1149773 RepID=UPI0011CADE92|nr:response regulator transcription factor [Phyllobacterium endophyticum]TXR46295.1 response regulator transcription factor [Phyllobacterium endophyticum]